MEHLASGISIVVMSDGDVFSCPAVDDIDVNARGPGVSDRDRGGGQGEQRAWTPQLCGVPLVPLLRS